MRAAAGSSTAVAWARQKSLRRCVTSASTVSPGMAPSTNTTRPSMRATAAPPWASSPTVNSTLENFLAEKGVQTFGIGSAFCRLHRLADQEHQRLLLTALEVRCGLRILGDDPVYHDLQFAFVRYLR